MNRTFFPLAWIALLAAGCAGPQTFDVLVTNRLSDPITVWMTKEKTPDGGRYEPGWMPPEALAVGTIGERLGGIAVDPGETAQTKISGYIASDDVAVLRVYRSTDLNMILTLHPGNPDRLDIPLNPGTTDIDIIKTNGELAEVPHRPAGK